MIAEESPNADLVELTNQLVRIDTAESISIILSLVSLAVGCLGSICNALIFIEKKREDIDDDNYKRAKAEL